MGAPTTPPTRVSDSLVVCDSAMGVTAGTVPIYIALNPNPNPNPKPHPHPNPNPNNNPRPLTLTLTLILARSLWRGVTR